MLGFLFSHSFIVFNCFVRRLFWNIDICANVEAKPVAVFLVKGCLLLV